MHAPGAQGARDAPACTIGVAAPEHAPALASLINTAYAAAEGDLWAAGRSGFRRTSEEELEQLIRARELLVATWAGTGDVVGCVRCHSAARPALEGRVPAAEFGLLAVAESYRGLGVGASLVRAVERWGVESGCRSVQCELLAPRDGTHPSKERLRHWYTRGLGYRLVHEQTRPFDEAYPALVAQFALTRPCLALYFAKELGPGAGM